MTRALTPTPQRATMSTRRSESATATAVTPPQTLAPSASSSPTTLAHEAALAANRLRTDIGRLALLTLRIVPEDQTRQLRSSLAIAEPSAIPTALPARTKPRKPTLIVNPSSALTTQAIPDPLETLDAIAARLRPLIRRADTLLIAQDGIAVLLRDPAPDGARIVAQRFHNALANHADYPPMPDSAPHLQVVVGIGYLTFDATGAIVGDDDPCDECATPPYGTQERSGATPAMAFGDSFARLFIRAWESDRKTPITIPLVDAPPTETGPTALATAHQVTAETTEAQRELALRRQATSLGVPFARLPTLLPGACRRTISRELARELRAIPIGYAHATLTVAMERPCDAQAVKRLRQATGHTIFPVLGAADEISRAITQLKP